MIPARPGPRHRPSSVDRLDPEIKAMIGQLRIEHGWTIDEILARLLELNQPVSRSALARHTRGLEEIGAQLRHSREMAKALVASRGDKPEDELADLNVELTHSLVLRLMTADAEVTFDPEQVKFLAQTLQSLASARKIDVDRQAKVRVEAQKAVLAAVAEVARTKGSGMSKATVDAIYAKVLGAE